jgi:hypothetical protein
MTPGFDFKRTDMASALFWMGAALIGMFAATVIGGMFPLGLLLPAWQVRVSGLILAVAPFAGIGAIMILLAQQMDEDSDELGQWAKRLRLLAIPAAIGFFLLLPLQTHAAFKLLRTAVGEERQVIGLHQKVLGAIQSANSEQDVLAAVRQLPGAPTEIRLNMPLPQAKQVMSEKLRGEIKRLDNQSEERNAGRWQQSLITWATNCFLSLCYGAGFAEIARFPNSRKSLLFSIRRALPWNRRLRSPRPFGY